ncbi:GTP-binding protein [Petrachloros mirabilis]
MVSDKAFSLGLVGVGEQESLLLSCMLALDLGKLPQPWEVSTNGASHATLYDLSSPEGQLAWLEAQAKPRPIPIAYSTDPMPAARWWLAKPAQRSSVVELLQQLTPNLQEQASAVEAGQVTAMPVPARDEVRPPMECRDSSLRQRLTALAERRQSTDSNAKEIKLIFGGSTGAGKSTALRTISDIPPIQTEARPSDLVRRQKTETTVAMDYGEMTLTNGKKLRLYGTPGQVRFEFMSHILCNGGLGLVLLANNSITNSMHELTYYLRLHGDFIKRTGAVLGITHMDQQATPTLEEYEKYLAREKWNIPVFSVDVRNREQVLALVETLVAELEAKGMHAS